MQKYVFSQPLQEGLIIRRTNRFLMQVQLHGQLLLCHCPCTGRISDFKLEQMPCLLSISSPKTSPQRKTNYTVEAISCNAPTAKHKHWIGINQNRANCYIEFFLQHNQLPQIVNCLHPPLREQLIGQSKLDFLAENIYIEVKTPLVILPLKASYCNNRQLQHRPMSNFNSFDRFIRHLQELGHSLQTHQKAVLISFYMFDALPFEPPLQHKTSPIVLAVNQAKQQGIEFWQVNAEFTPEYVRLLDYFPMLYKLV